MTDALQRWRRAVRFGAMIQVARVVAPAAVISVAVLVSADVSVAHADEGVKVGASLEATSDVSLDEATIRKGSKVSVSAKRVVGGRVFLDVALADGHVVKAVPLPDIQRSFRVVAS